MKGRIPVSMCRQRYEDHLGRQPALRTPGPLGHTDALDANVPGMSGDSPGPLGQGDYAQDGLQGIPRWLFNRARNMTIPRREKELNASKLKAFLRDHEPVSARTRENAAGQRSVGLGLNLDRPEAKDQLESLGLSYKDVLAGRVELTQSHIQGLMDASIQLALSQAKQTVRSFDELPEERKRAVVILVMRLGTATLAGAAGLLKALGEGDFEEAAAEMKKSAWYSQGGRWARDLVQLMKGELDERTVTSRRLSKLAQDDPPPHTAQMFGTRPVFRPGRRTGA